jgi:hypothetical protein
MNRRQFLAAICAAPVAPAIGKAVAAPGATCRNCSTPFSPAVLERLRAVGPSTQVAGRFNFTDRDAKLFLKHLAEGLNQTIEAEIERMYAREFPVDKFPVSDTAWFTKDGVRVL